AASWLALMQGSGPVFRTELSGKETYIICGHEADLAAWKTPDNWLYGPPSPGGDFFLAELGSMHVSQLDGEPHRRARKLILPAFGVAAVMRELPAVSRTLAAGFDAWQGQGLDVHPVLSRLLTRCLSRSQLETPLSEHEIDQLVSFEESFIPAVSLTLQDREKWYARPAYQQARRTAFAVFERVVAERLAGERPGDSLDLIMDKPPADGMAALSVEELERAAYLLLVAGVGNIANIVCAALWGLAAHPSWLARLQEELQGFDPEKLRQGMGVYPVLKAVIQEVERCYLPAPVIPKMTACDQVFLGVHIPGGVNVMQLHGLAHFEADRYEDPYVFNPGRWLSAGSERANAFGGGTHLCLGMGVTRLYVPLCLGMLVDKFDWEVAGPPKLVSQDPALDYAPRTTHFPVTFRARKLPQDVAAD
ncbi:MAG: cytochrome P450, partial [Proteobacteria bacterium]|nr:cytochrome P450 [Pseudomonadota bacterium]